MVNKGKTWVQATTDGKVSGARHHQPQLEIHPVTSAVVQL